MIKELIRTIVPFWLGVKLRGAWQKFLGLYYFGNTYECPLCGNRFRKMLPGGTLHPVFKEYNIIGGGYRKNAVCPRCYCTDRDRLVFLYLKNHSDILGSSRSLLHIAPEGALRALFMKEKNLDYITGFKNADAYKGYYYQQSEQNIDITSIPFPDERFDMIICNHVLEHIPEDHIAIRELFRVLKPGGSAILQVPISDRERTYENPAAVTPADRLREFGQEDHVRIYGNDFFEKLRSAGFVASPVQVISLESGDHNRYALMEGERIHLAVKPVPSAIALT